jgi:hypothetical protein
MTDSPLYWYCGIDASQTPIKSIPQCIFAWSKTSFEKRIVEITLRIMNLDVGINVLKELPPTFVARR